MSIEYSTGLIGDKFRSLYNTDPVFFKAPGRVNLIGEHTDYNDGFVLPGAIDYSIIFAMNRNYEGKFRFHSLDFDSSFTAESVYEKVGDNKWASYLLGVVAQFEKEDLSVDGIDCVFGGNIPLGAGLSSSAALESGFVFGINNLFDYQLDPLKMVKMAQKAEHEFVGVMCGIMDQFASIMGKKDHVFKLDCRSLDFEYYPLKMDDFSVALVDTRVVHNLASSEYNKRRSECQTGVSFLQKHFPDIAALRDASIDKIEFIADRLPKKVAKRCSYVVNENTRVLKSCEALLNGNFARFGELMYQSHFGLRYDYEVSCKELDILVESTKDKDYVLGSRMMGGGFGGCTINLITKGEEDKFRYEILKEYKRNTKIDALVYMVKLSHGAGVAC